MIDNSSNTKSIIGKETLVRADSHVSSGKTLGQSCWKDHECQSGSICVRVNPKTMATCQCPPDHIPSNTWAQCLPPRRYKENCDFSQQCQHFDPNTICAVESSDQTVWKCLCNDYFKHNKLTEKCEYCEDRECRRQFERWFFADKTQAIYDKRYNRWYHNVNGVFGMWSSILIMALPISFFLFFLGIRLTKQAIRLYSGEPATTEANTLMAREANEHRFLVSLPPEQVIYESPPAYEDLAKTIRLPTYEEALNMNS